MIRDVEKIKKLPPRVGQSIMVKWLETGKIGGPAQAIQALCYECMGYYKDRKLLEGDCGIPNARYLSSIIITGVLILSSRKSLRQPKNRKSWSGSKR